MAEELKTPEGASKEEKYRYLLPRLKALIENENDTIARMANMSAAIKETFGFLWAGFYRVVDSELVLGPFQGPIACTRIKYGKGVCGAAWQREETIIVPDVDLFPGHIACSSLSKSEIAIPVKRDGSVVGVLDVDSSNRGEFDEIDKFYLEQFVDLL